MKAVWNQLQDWLELLGGPRLNLLDLITAALVLGTLCVLWVAKRFRERRFERARRRVALGDLVGQLDLSTSGANAATVKTRTVQLHPRDPGQQEAPSGRTGEPGAAGIIPRLKHGVEEQRAAEGGSEEIGA